jgi:hypothetical protein
MRRPGRAGTPQLARTLLARHICAAGSAQTWRARTSSGSPLRASNSRTLSVAILVGSTRLSGSRRPELVCECLHHAGEAWEQPIRDGKLRERNAHRGCEHEHDRAAGLCGGAPRGTVSLWLARSAASTRASRTAARNTLSNAERRASSVVVETVPAGVRLGCPAHDDPDPVARTKDQGHRAARHDLGRGASDRRVKDISAHRL